MDDEKLTYKIHAFSSYSGVYSPEKILKNDPTDQACRWSSETNNPPQFLILKLEKFSIVKSITFGKFERSHVCNLKRFVVYGSTSETGYVELFAGGLRNDSVAETFNVKHTIGANEFPCLYIKIVPLQSWAVSFNFSIWYVEIRGDCRWDIVKEAASFLKQYKEREAVRLCLKHLRQMHYDEIFEFLEKKSNVHLEHPLVSKLYDALVVQGGYSLTEGLIKQAINDGFFDGYISRQKLTVEWRPVKIEYSSEESSPIVEQTPGPRGGHQMVIDEINEIIYLFGGYDGSHSLSDFWSFDIRQSAWTCLCKNTASEGGPSSRSLHRMVLDGEHGRIFCLGKYLPRNVQPPDSNADFFVYSIAENFWTLVNDDTRLVGGPPLLYDHQLSIDRQNHVIYCFGGHVVDNSLRPEDQPKFGGLYAYHVQTNCWDLLRYDMSEEEGAPPAVHIKGRAGHSMEYFFPTTTLYIVGGQRGSEFLLEVLLYNTASDQITTISLDSSIIPAPLTGLTQSSALDEDFNEMYIYMGFHKEDASKINQLRNLFYSFDLKTNDWKCLYSSDVCENYCKGKNSVPSKMQPIKSKKLFATILSVAEPCPRFAHQFVYDNVSKVHYLHGGNPGSTLRLECRLDDFWELRLKKPDSSELLRLCVMDVRICQFYEKLNDPDPNLALRHLQEGINPVVNRKDSRELQKLHDLASKIFEINLNDEENTKSRAGKA